MLASNYTYQYEHYQTPSTILFGQLRRWSIWLNRVSVLNQARCTPLVYLYIELVYTRVIASGEARLISIYSYTHQHSLWDNGIYRPLLFVTRYLLYLLQLYRCYLPFSEHSSYGSSNILDGSGGSGMKIALQFSRSCARGRVPEVLTSAIIIYIIGVASTHASRRLQ